MVDLLVKVIEVVAAFLGIGSGGYAAVRYIKGRQRKLTMARSFACAAEVLRKIERDRWKPEAVIALGRSGAIFGGWFAGNLGSLPVFIIDKRFDVTDFGRRIVLVDADKILKRLSSKFSTAPRFLVVEGATTSGNSFIVFEDHKKQAFPAAECRTVSLYVHHGSVSIPDYFGSYLTPWPERFPWHYSDLYERYLHGTTK